MSSQAPIHRDQEHPSGAPGLSIAAVERETGVTKDTLRIWEKRYSFPTPTRDEFGDRLYSQAQVQQLKLIRRLMDLGLRPGKVVGLDGAALQALLNDAASSSNPDLSKTKKTSTSLDPLIEGLLDEIGQHAPTALRHNLSHAQMRMGLAAFVTELVAPLTTAVGDAWASGRFQVFEEHLYTEVITGVLRQAISAMPQRPETQSPRVLLTTLPQEPHGLGLLMVEALLALEGCNCISLGTQTPLTDVIQAACAHQVNVVALSFSSVQKAALVQTSLRELRAMLPERTALWVGGDCAALYQRPIAGVRAIQHLSGIQPLLQQWRHAH